jgi:hypothetical protein
MMSFNQRFQEIILAVNWISYKILQNIFQRKEKYRIILKERKMLNQYQRIEIDLKLKKFLLSRIKLFSIFSIFPFKEIFPICSDAA